MSEGTQPFVAARSSFPTRLAQAVTQISFVPLDRTKRLVERADLFDYRPTDHPRPNNDIDLCNSKITQNSAGTACADHKIGVVQVLPFNNRPLERIKVEPANQTQQTEVRICIKCRDKFLDEPIYF